MTLLWPAYGQDLANRSGPLECHHSTLNVGQIIITHVPDVGRIWAKQYVDIWVGNKVLILICFFFFLQNIFQSDWHMLQLDTVMREMFRDIDGVIFLDVWQMTSCHYLREHIHPGPVVIANEVNMFLSYVSPSCGLFKLVLFHKENGKLTWLREG